VTEEQTGHRSSVEALRRVMKPRDLPSRAGWNDIGNGDPCKNAEGELTGHGKMYVLSNGTQWCAHQSHDMDRKEARNA
jgi:hypothetical protein